MSNYLKESEMNKIGINNVKEAIRFFFDENRKARKKLL